MDIILLGIDALLIMTLFCLYDERARHKARTAYLISKVDALNSELKTAEMAVTILKRGS